MITDCFHDAKVQKRFENTKENVKKLSADNLRNKFE